MGDSIKDRIASANANADDQDQDEGVEGDDLESLLEEFGYSDPGEPRPAWETEEDEGEEESAESIETTEGEESSGSEEEGEESIETEGEVVSNSDTTEGSEAAASQQETPALDMLRSMGYSTDGITESQAVGHVLSGFRDLAGQMRNVQGFAKIGQEVGADIDGYRAWKAAQGQGSAVKPSDEKKGGEKKISAADLLAEVRQLSQAAQDEPEYDPRWETYLGARQITFDGNFYLPANGQGHLASIADKMNAHRSWQNRNLDTALKTPKLLEKVAELLAERDSAKSGDGLSMEQVEAHIKTKQTAEQERAFVNDALKRNPWIFAHDSKGRVITNPINNERVLTPEGILYYKEIARLQEKGVTNSQDQHYYALAAMNVILKNKSVDGGAASGQNATQSGEGAASSAANANSAGSSKPAGKKPPQGAAKTPADKRMELLQKQKNRATRQPNSQVVGGDDSGGSETSTSGKLPSLGDMLTDAFAKQGLMKKKSKRSTDEDE